MANQAPFGNVEGIFEAFGDLFGVLFGNLPDIATDAKLDDAEAAAGAIKQLAFQRRGPCAACDGVGGDRRIECTACAGKVQHQHVVGPFTVTGTCESCKGLGATYPKICATCNGHRTQLAPATATIAIPAGSMHGSTIRVAGEGNPRPDGTRGDLVVFLLVGGRPDPRAERPAQMMEFPALPRARQASTPRESAIYTTIAVAVFVALVVALISLR